MQCVRDDDELKTLAKNALDSGIVKFNRILENTVLHDLDLDFLFLILIETELTSTQIIIQTPSILAHLYYTLQQYPIHCY